MRKGFKPRFRKTPPPTGLWNWFKKAMTPVLEEKLMRPTLFLDKIKRNMRCQETTNS